MIEITEGNMTAIVGYIGTIFSDLAPLILLIVGVGVGLMIISVIIKALKG